MSLNYKFVQSTPASKRFAILAAIIIVVLCAAPWWAGRADIRLLGEIYIYIALASLWNLLAGYTGLVSVGQQLYVGLGGYALFTLAMYLGVSPLLAIPIAGVAGAIIALPLSWLLFRLQGAYFAIGTWVAAEVFLLSFAQVSSLGGGSGTSLPASLVKSIASSRELREWYIYWTTCTLTLATVGLIIWLLRSRPGLALTSIRDNETASESLGISIVGTKTFVYALTCGVTTMLGALIFLQKLRISPQAAFSLNDWTAFVIFMVVIGGIGTIEGPIIGVLIFFVLRETLSDYGTIYLMILGFSAIVVMLKAPQGLWGTFVEKTGLTLIPTRRTVIIDLAKQTPESIETSDTTDYSAKEIT